MVMERIGPYEIIGVIGEGGMGRVHRARDTRYDRVVALKVIAQDKASDADFAALFRREAGIVTRLNSPHIVPIHNHGEVDGLAYLDMRHVDGMSLSRAVAEFGPTDLRSGLDIVAQAASALDDAHAAGVVHRDVKPGNLLVDRKGFVYLADFGIAVVEGHHPQIDEGLAGSLSYLAPERFAGAPSAVGDDVYALGCVLHFLLTGSPPFPVAGEAEARRAHERDAPPCLVGRVRGVDASVDAAINAALAKDPRHRPASAGRWVADVRRAAQASRAAMRPSAAPAGSGGGPHPSLVVVLALLVALALVLAAVVATR